ncbi:Phenylalanine--tRNA ligase alpha subunit [uncultured archaeon]|nr:Phenylalanine--tRNA ligase alpha subunit [uncultured archaeon]
MELHPAEIKVLKTLGSLKGPLYPKQIADKAGISEDAVLRAAGWLTTKKFVEVMEYPDEVIALDAEGEDYAENGLPERQLLNACKGKQRIPAEEVRKAVPQQVFSIAVGWIRRKNHGALAGTEFIIGDASERDDEKLLRKIKESKAIHLSALDEKEKAAFDLLASRKNVLRVTKVKTIQIKLTPDGEKIIPSLKDTEASDKIGQLTPEILKGGSWKNKTFRPYDVTVYVKPNHPAKKHPLRRAMTEIRQIFTGMGFREISGDYVESSFWNFDALFTAQDHPVRDMQDTFYLKNPNRIQIPHLERLKDPVKQTHENGWKTGSTGWQYKWKEDEALKTVLRTHTTCVTSRYLASITPADLPQKVFSIGKVFRNEAIDYKHLPEFYQVEGIIADKNANFRGLLGILKEFYDKMGFKKIRFRPGYFPYTEMSVEPEVYLEERGEWVELGGAGIFRPEVTQPILGEDIPVLAWGLGLDRVVTLRTGLTDIRQLYQPDIDALRESRL